MAMYRRFHPCMQQSAATGRASQWLMGRPQADKFPNKPWEHPFDGTQSRYIRSQLVMAHISTCLFTVPIVESNIDIMLSYDTDDFIHSLEPVQ